MCYWSYAKIAADNKILISSNLKNEASKIANCEAPNYSR